MIKPVDLVEQPPVKLYKPVIQHPLLLLGFVIHNEYDERRLSIKRMLRPMNICQDGTNIHGIELNPKKSVHHLCETISRAQPITHESYKNILKYNRLSCDNCSQHLRNGVYPIDISCVSTLSNNKYSSNYMSLRAMLDTSDDLPWFSNWTEFNIFMICPSFN